MGPKYWKKQFNNAFEVKLQLDIFESIKEFLKYQRRLPKINDPNAPGAPDPNDFEQMMAHWDVTNANVAEFRRAKKWQIAMSIVLFAVGSFIALFGDLKIAWQGLLVMLCGIMSFFDAAFRLWVIENQRFVFFKDWICGRWE